ncbi:MAG: putative ABC transporter permease [Oscillospiraceae bacterium]|nr:putative ABC transporter permease [Oscillospiraceae bacterium]
MLLLRAFIVYSFLGFLLEVAFARVTRSPKQDRKCYILLPLCPVYGVGALMIHGLAGGGESPLRVAVAGILGAAAAELGMGIFYRYALGVEFWDYRGLRGNLGGLICPQFCLCWGVLALVMVYWVDPLLLPLLGRIPAGFDPPALCLLLGDTLVSAAALRRTGGTDVLRWYR